MVNLIMPKFYPFGWDLFEKIISPIKSKKFDIFQFKCRLIGEGSEMRFLFF